MPKSNAGKSAKAKPAVKPRGPCICTGAAAPCAHGRHEERAGPKALRRGAARGGGRTPRTGTCGGAPATGFETRADIDPLTDLPNRRAFERELARSLAYVKRHGTGAALLYLDLDDFKRINDRHGHSAGDTMLRAVASVLGRHVRASDVVARIGGDEFALLLWNCDEANALTKALALEVAIGRTTATHEGAALTVGASVGSALLLPLDQPAETIERADRAMYARKPVRRAAHAAE